MPRRSMELLTESMLYILMALSHGPMCGVDAAQYIETISGGRLRMGPATLYTILAKFQEQKYIQEVQAQGRKRTYAITDKGRRAYEEELQRLRQCLADADLMRRDHDGE